MMKEVTAKELAKAFEGVLVDVMPEGYHGIAFEMTKADLEYREEEEELAFLTGNRATDGFAAVFIEENWIESIEHDEESDEYVISFEKDMPNIVVSRYKMPEELEQERAARSQQ